MYPILHLFLALETGEREKTVDNCFFEVKSTKQGKMKQGRALSTF